jgi:hypothetical protein
MTNREFCESIIRHLNRPLTYTQIWEEGINWKYKDE